MMTTSTSAIVESVIVWVSPLEEAADNDAVCRIGDDPSRWKSGEAWGAATALAVPLAGPWEDAADALIGAILTCWPRSEDTPTPHSTAKAIATIRITRARSFRVDMVELLQ
jgi:hypothetical protein